jgi:hypothetical protein
MFDSFVPSLSLIERAYLDSSSGRGEQNGSNQIDDFRILNSEVISSYGGSIEHADNIRPCEPYTTVRLTPVL